MAKIFASPLAVAPLCALLLCAAFPPLEWGWLVWVALVPLLLAMKIGAAGVRVWAGAGFAYGVVFYAVQYAWVPHTLLELGGMAPARFAVFALGGLFFLSALPAAMLAGARWLWMRVGLSPFFSLPVFFTFQDMFLGIAPFGGMPWGSLAATQTAGVGAAVLVPLAGGSGLVLLMTAVNAGWARVAEAFSRGLGGGARGAISLAIISVVAASPWSILGGGKGEQPGFSALLVPSDLPTTPGLDSNSVRRNMRHFLTRSLQAWPSTPTRPKPGDAGTLVLWPEAALGGALPAEKAPPDLVEVSSVMDADFLFGADTQRAEGSFNTALLVTRRAAAMQQYDKLALVPFGEYLPTGFGWAFGRKITRGDEDYQPGQKPPVLTWRGHRLGIAICFESLLPGHVRAAAAAGAEVIAVLANDQWLTLAARTQHIRLSGLRGLEVGRDVVFVANGGWSGLVRGGSPVAMVRWDQDPVWVRPRLRKAVTPWVRWGYGPLVFLLALWGLGAGLISLIPSR